MYNKQGGSRMYRIMMALALFFSGCSIPTLDEIILRPNVEIKQTPEDLGYVYQEFTLPIDNTRQIVVWYIPSVESKGLVVIVPGSDANKSLYMEGIPVFNTYGYDLLLMDYEGFGSSPGTPSLDANVDDVMAAVAFAKTINSKVFLFGVSLGAPLAAYSAYNFDLQGCILEGSFIVNNEAELWLRQNGFDWKPLWDIANGYIYPQVTEEYDIIKYISMVDEPKLIQHSIDDEVCPFESGVMVFNAAADPKEFWEMRGPHGKMIRLETELYTEKLIGWMDSNLD